MKVVLHIAESIAGGGAESVFRDTIAILTKQDCKNKHLVACIQPVNNVGQKVDYPFEENNAKGIKLILSQIFSYRNYIDLKRALFSSKPDIIHLQNYGNLSPSILRAILRYKKQNIHVKVIHTVHTFEYVCSHNAGYDYRKKRKCTDCADKKYKLKIFYRGCSRLGYFHSIGKGITNLISSYYVSRNVIDLWTTPSKFLRSFMISNFLEVEKVSVLRNPCDFENLKEDISIGKRQLFEFVYFGRFSEEKNIECLLKAFKIVSKEAANVRLSLIGQGEIEDELKDLCMRLDLLDFVTFEPFLPKAELIERLKSSKVSVLPSKCYETASLVTIESIMLNLIPIVCNHGGMKEMIELTNFGVTFEDNDEVDLSKKMLFAMNNYSNIMKDIETVKSDISNVFGADVFMEDIKKIYSI
jgi:glycosyltransferase involved in cell wall biosynthesis